MAAWGEWIGSAPGHGGTAGAADGCSCTVLGLGAAAWHLGKLDLLATPKQEQATAFLEVCLVNVSPACSVVLKVWLLLSRTLEYLMRHLACLAGSCSITNMPAKNLAIVWAPNLFR